MTTTPNTTASGAADTLRSAMNRAFSLGQTYWQQADSESYAEQDKSDSTYKKYKALLEETCTTLAECAPVAPTMVDMVPPATSRDRWMYEQGRLAERDPRTSKAAPAPQPAPMPYPTDAQIDAVYEQTMGKHLRSQDAPAVRRFGRAMFLYAWNAAAPKAAPAINKVSDIIDAYGMTPGEPERVADIPGLAEALEAAFADGSAKVTGATPLQQGEYLPLPDADTHCYDEDTGKDVWSHSAEQMHALVDADRAMRAAHQGDGVPTWQAAQDPMLECSIQPRPLSHPLAAYHSAMLKGPLHYTWQDKPHRLVYDLIAAVKHYAQAGQAAPAPVPVPVPSGLRVERGFRWDDKAHHHIPNLPVEFESVPALSPNDMKGWKDRDAIAAMLTTPRPAPVAEDADPLQDAANWLVTSRATTSATELGSRLCIGYNRADRLFNAARAQAAQPEGDA